LEGRRVNMRARIVGEYTEFHRASEGYASEAMEPCEENLRRGVDVV
jgi:hypothetical protein